MHIFAARCDRHFAARTEARRDGAQSPALFRAARQQSNGDAYAVDWSRSSERRMTGRASRTAFAHGRRFSSGECFTISRTLLPSRSSSELHGSIAISRRRTFRTSSLSSRAGWPQPSATFLDVGVRSPIPSRVLARACHGHHLLCLPAASPPCTPPL